MSRKAAPSANTGAARHDDGRERERRERQERREMTPASVPAVRRGDALDVADLPSYGFAHRSLMWWGTAGMIAIEGVAFAFMIVVYFYLRGLADTWPPGGVPPGLFWGTLNMGLILVSYFPNAWSSTAAVDHDLSRVRRNLIACSVLGVLMLVIRGFEFTTLNVRGDDNAYGSAVWMLLGLHTFNLVTDVVEFFVLTAAMYQEPLEGKRFVDIAENSGYWDFILVSWVPIYAVVYWGARF
jgi:heme/copper-type cytochrome/quinol oxidase subunit 3